MIMENQNTYQNGKIYKIVDVGYSKCYIGSTIETLSMRMCKHRSKYKTLAETKPNRYCSFVMFQEFGVENCKIELIENYPCNSKEELIAREGYHMKNNDCVNKRFAGQTPSERNKHYYDTHQAHMQEYRRNRLETHHDIDNAAKLASYHRNVCKHKVPIKCQCGAVVSKYNMLRHTKCLQHQVSMAELTQSIAVFQSV